MLNELHICICQRKVLVILQVSRVLDHLVWTTSTNCHGQRQSQHTHTHRPTQPQTDRDRDRTAARVATAVGLWLVWRIFTRICLNYFQFSQLHGPSDLTPSLLLSASIHTSVDAWAQQWQLCKLVQAIYTHSHIRAFAWLCLFGALCPVLEVSQFTAYVCSLMRFGCLCPVPYALCPLRWKFTCVFASN